MTARATTRGRPGWVAVTLGSGLTVRLGKPTRYKPGVISVGYHRDGATIKFTVVAINDSDEVHDLTFAKVTATFGASGIAADQLVDGKVDWVLTGKIGAGRRRSCTVAFFQGSIT